MSETKCPFPVEELLFNYSLYCGTQLLTTSYDHSMIMAGRNIEILKTGEFREINKQNQDGHLVAVSLFVIS